MEQAAASLARPDDFDSGTVLPHLAGPAAAVRQAMAAHFLAGCAHVVEIGGAGLPITGFLDAVPRSVTVIDPKIAPYEAQTLRGEPCRVRHVAAKFQRVTLELPPFGYALVMLGLSLKPAGQRMPIDAPLLTLAREAQLVVIDHAVDLARAVPQAAALLEHLPHDVIADIRLRLGDDRLGDAPFSERRFLVLRAPGARGRAA